MSLTLSTDAPNTVQNGAEWQECVTLFACAPNITTTAHFVGSGHFQAVYTSSREHTLHAPDVRSAIRSVPWGGCSHLYSHLLRSLDRSHRVLVSAATGPT